MAISLHDRFFYLAGFFLTGVVFASATEPFITLAPKLIFILLAAILTAGILRISGKIHLLPFALMLVLGSGYYLAYGAYRKNPSIIFNRPTTIAGVIADARYHLDSQELTLDNNITIYADRYPAFNYGDRIEVKGIVKPSRSLLKAGMVNARYAAIKLISHDNGNTIKEKLLAIRRAFENNIKKVLPREQAAFLSGLTVGTTEEFSGVFKDDLLKSGATHLVALSGSNITLIVWFIGMGLGYIMPPRKTFAPTIGIIMLFVIMAGAESSLVRAAVMGVIMLAAKQYERTRNFRNAITAAALLMVLYNPRLLAFDLGFQLSFLAMLGIAYIEPWLAERSGKIKNWLFARAFFTTIAAQAAVMPLLIIKTGNIAPWSFIPNMLLLPFIPWTMGLGFITGAIGFAASPLAFIPALAVSIFLRYEMAIIHFFAFSG